MRILVLGLILTTIGLFNQSCSSSSEENGNSESAEVKQNKDGFVIKGQLSNVVNKEIFIREFPIDQTLQLPNNGLIGTGLVNERGEFTITGKVSEPTLAYLQIDQSGYRYIMLDNTNYEVSGLYDNFNQISIKGNNTEKVLPVLDQIMGYVGNVNQAQQALQMAQYQGGMTAEQAAQLNQQFQQNYIAFNDAVKSYIPNSNNPLAIALTASLLDPAFAYEVVEEASNKIKDINPKSKYRAALDSKLAPYKKWIGREAPEIAEKNPNGQVMKLSDTRGKYVLLDFWASWCKPCRVENPNVVKLYDKYKNKGFTVYSVSMDRAMPNWVQAINKDNLKWPYHVSDLGFWNAKPAKLYGVSSIPATFLLDKEGKVIAYNLRGFMLEMKLEQLISEG